MSDLKTETQNPSKDDYEAISIEASERDQTQLCNRFEGVRDIYQVRVGEGPKI